MSCAVLLVVAVTASCKTKPQQIPRRPIGAASLSVAGDVRVGAENVAEQRGVASHVAQEEDVSAGGGGRRDSPRRFSPPSELSPSG